MMICVSEQNRSDPEQNPLMNTQPTSQSPPQPAGFAEENDDTESVDVKKTTQNFQQMMDEHENSTPAKPPGLAKVLSPSKLNFSVTSQEGGINKQNKENNLDQVSGELPQNPAGESSLEEKNQSDEENRSDPEQRTLNGGLSTSQSPLQSPDCAQEDDDTEPGENVTSDKGINSPPGKPPHTPTPPSPPAPDSSNIADEGGIDKHKEDNNSDQITGKLPQDTAGESSLEEGKQQTDVLQGSKPEVPHIGIDIPNGADTAAANQAEKDNTVSNSQSTSDNEASDTKEKPAGQQEDQVPVNPTPGDAKDSEMSLAADGVGDSSTETQTSGQIENEPDPENSKQEEKKNTKDDQEENRQPESQRSSRQGSHDSLKSAGISTDETDKQDKVSSRCSSQSENNSKETGGDEGERQDEQRDVDASEHVDSANSDKVIDSPPPDSGEPSQNTAGESSLEEKIQSDGGKTSDPEHKSNASTEPGPGKGGAASSSGPEGAGENESDMESTSSIGGSSPSQSPPQSASLTETENSTESGPQEQGPASSSGPEGAEKEINSPLGEPPHTPKPPSPPAPNPSNQGRYQGDALDPAVRPVVRPSMMGSLLVRPDRPGEAGVGVTGRRSRKPGQSVQAYALRLKELYRKLQQQVFNNPEKPLSFTCESPRSQQAWREAFALCRRTAVSTEDGFKGYVWPAQRRGFKIPARSEVVVWGRARAGPAGKDYCGLVKALEEPNAVSVARTLTVVKNGRTLIRVRNLNNFPITLGRYQRIGRLYQVDDVDVRGARDVDLTPNSDGEVEVGLIEATDEREDAFDVQELVDGSDLTTEQAGRLTALIQKWEKVFSKHEEDFGRTDAVTHTIPTGDAVPIRERFRPLPPLMYKEMRSLLADMLDRGVITASSSPWSAPIVMVKKKDGSWRFCVDYRRLNSVTHKDAFPLPRIEETLTSLSQAEWFSTLDLSSGYWQVEVDSKDREKTAFTTPLGLYEFQRMPFGLCNAPATFQRLMQQCLSGQITERPNYRVLLVYLDDIIVYSPDFDTHLQNLEEVFERLWRHGLKLRPDKCKLLQREVKFLGHVVNQAGVMPDPDKITAVTEWPIPTSVREVRAFLGLAGYYRRFVKGFAKIARPLNNLLTGIPKNDKRSCTKSIDWTPECQTAFDQLKEVLTQAPVLAYADYTKPFSLYTDASYSGLGAVLAQTQNGKERVIAYASRSLHPAERNDSNYSSFKLELLALKWAITEKFKDYLTGAKFTVFTDNNPVAHLQTAKLGAVEQRWVAQMASFDFDVKYRAGRENVNADALSRFPTTPAQKRAATNVAAVVTSATALDQGDSTAMEPGEDWRALQEVDPDIQYSSCRDVWKKCHEAAAHAGTERTLTHIRRHFFWPSMEKERMPNLNSKLLNLNSKTLNLNWNRNPVDPLGPPKDNALLVIETKMAAAWEGEIPTFKQGRCGAARAQQRGRRPVHAAQEERGSEWDNTKRADNTTRRRPPAPSTQLQQRQGGRCWCDRTVQGKRE
ncbi:LOW QUALITY PROTEIN: uncharacterized protein LOC115402705 [Salarias fasciatus]|uniref:LOW QUALITY PROTEIN: uncharacterized protein LOC115402705 n=1 Tax=Salarias fasciatus TaxID=181472 RepID=UPI00117662DA|nr:LOW QUALITY PROTEIN: uncharacterized protein LOC115402705 [Salarias fasciatus]